MNFWQLLSNFASPCGAVEVSAREENEIMAQFRATSAPDAPEGTAPSRRAVNSGGYMAATPPSAIKMRVSSMRAADSSAT